MKKQDENVENKKDRIGIVKMEDNAKEELAGTVEEEEADKKKYRIHSQCKYRK